MKRLIEKTVFCGFGHRLTLRDGADKALAGGRECDDRWRRASALGVFDDGRLAALENGHARVCRAQVDSNGLCHQLPLLLRSSRNLSGIVEDFGARVKRECELASGASRYAQAGPNWNHAAAERG